MNGLGGKTALITGGSSGIGSAIACRLAQDGASIVITYYKGSAKAEEVVSQIQSRGGTATAMQADMSKLNDIRRVFSQVEALGSHVDIVVVNAASYWLKPLQDVTEEEFDSMFALNAKGTFFILQEAARRVTDGGRIMFISSTVTSKRFPNGAVYSGSKAAGERFVKALADELGPRRITANSISPGPVDTAMLPNIPELRETLKKMSPLERMGQPGDIAGIVAFLAGDEGGWINGQNILAGGGNI